MGYRTPDFVALLASKHIAYAANAAFQRGIAEILQPHAADNKAGPTTSVEQEKQDRANGDPATAKR